MRKRLQQLLPDSLAAAIVRCCILWVVNQMHDGILRDDLKQIASSLIAWTEDEPPDPDGPPAVPLRLVRDD